MPVDVLLVLFSRPSYPFKMRMAEQQKYDWMMENGRMIALLNCHWYPKAQVR